MVAANIDAQRAESFFRPIRKVIVIGCSGLGMVAVDIIQNQGLYEIVGFLDSYRPPGIALSGHQILGACEELPALLKSGRVDGGIVAIGDNWVRRKVVNELLELAPQFHFITAVHPSVQIGTGVEIGRGSIIQAGVVICPYSRLGEFCVLTSRASLDHECVMGDFASMGPASATGGNVEIGAFSVIGIGAVISHGLRVGEHTVIGAGATVVRDIPDRVVAYGTPACIIRTREPGDPYLEYRDSRK